MRRNRKYFRVSTEELTQIEQRAAAARMRVSVYIRACALGSAPTQVPEINKEAFVELRKIGTNLNQIARRLNSEPASSELAEAAASEVITLRNALTHATPHYSNEAEQ